MKSRTKLNRLRCEVWREGRRVGRTYEHRVVVETHLGRPLESYEVVHHLNGDPLDNRPDNLVALTSQSAHMFLHHYLNREERGVGHLFTLHEVLRIADEGVVWGTQAGLTALFGKTLAEEFRFPRSFTMPRRLRRRLSRPVRHELPLALGGHPWALGVQTKPQAEHRLPYAKRTTVVRLS